MARRIGLAALIWLGVMWLAPSAGAAIADGAPVPSPTVPADAAPTTETSLRSTLESALQVPAPVLQRVEPVVTAVLEVPARTLNTLQPVLEPVVDGVTDLVTPVIEGRPVPLPPGVLPELPAIPEVAAPSVPPIPLPAAPVSETVPTDAATTEALPGDPLVVAPPSDSGAPSVIDGIDPSGRTTADSFEDSSHPAPRIDPEAATALVSDHAPTRSRAPEVPTAPAVPAPVTTGGLDRSPTPGVPVTAPRVPPAFAERFGLHETPPVSQPPSRPPVAPD